ncbi:MAG TPA: hypothetical protein VGL45_11740 [Bradyrhizobium sp.]
MKNNNVRLCLTVGFCAIALLVFGSPDRATAQDAPLKVSVDGKTFLVENGAAAKAQDGGVVDALTSRKASLAARVLDEQILRSEPNRQLFSASSRAAVMADRASGRLIEAWQRPLLSNSSADGVSDATLASATESFKAWATRLADDPKEMALAIARKDYLEGIAAFQENAGIYRSVTVKNELLSFEAASRFLHNELAMQRLVAARDLEKQVSGGGASAMIIGGAGPDQANIAQLKQRLQNEVVGQLDKGIKTPDDLERIFGRFRNIAEAESVSLRNYRDAVRPAIIRFTFSEPKGASPAPVPANAGSVIRFNGQNTVIITIPAIATNPANRKPFDLTGGILLPPAGAGRPSPATPGNDAKLSNNGPAGGTPGNGNPNSGAASGVATQSGAVADVGQATVSPGSTVNHVNDQSSPVPGDPDNLKTYSSKPYHSANGMVFNPLNGLWENQADRSDWRIPTVITCCDETGLAFPDDALEARQAYWWGDGSGGGTDPNCNRLYVCGPDIGPIVDPGTDGATDKDAEILQAISYLKQLPPGEGGSATWQFLKNLPRAYRHRAIYLLVQYNAQHSGSTRYSSRAPIAAAPGRGAPASFAGKSSGNNSTITGLGGVSSSYHPITQTAAQGIVGQYKSIPGGVTLEGGSADLSFIKSVKYLPEANAFVLNDDLVYLNPVAAGAFSEIQHALATDDRLGVSLTSGLAIVYGNLSPQSDVATNLELVDRFLGDITFGARRITKGYVFAPGYEGRSANGNGNLAVYFNIHDFHFLESADGRLSRSGSSLDTTLVPLAAAPGSDGGHLPDADRIKKGDIPPEYIANLRHLQDNIGYYARERIIRTAIAYGEAASFVRSLKSNGVSFDVSSLGAGLAPGKSLSAPGTAGPSAASSESCALAATHWTSTESIGTREAYQDHLARFPNCTFATLAAARIAALDAKGVPPPMSDPPVKTCGRGLAMDSSGDCGREREPAVKKVVARRAAAPRAGTGGGPPSALNCGDPAQIMACANKALSTLPH